jgi:hypothetical protein
VFISVHSWLKNKKPTAIWQWVDKFRERIKPRLPRWSATRLQAAGLSFDSREQTNRANGEGQTIFKAMTNDPPSPRRRGPG